MKIKFDYRFDTNGFFDNPNRRAALEKAGEIWSSLLQDDFDNIPVGVAFNITNPITGATEEITLEEEIDDLLIFVGASQSPFGNKNTGQGLSTDYPHWSCCCCGCNNLSEEAINLNQPGVLSRKSQDTFTETLAQAQFDGVNLKGDIFQRRIASDFRNQGEATNFEPWAGTIAFNTGIDWDFSLSNPASDKIDFISVALHEIGHILGIGTAPIFNTLGQTGKFEGVNAKAVNNGNPIPLETDLGHVKEGFSGNTVLLDPLISSGRYLPTEIDLALLADLGYEIEGFSTQGQTLPLATGVGELIFGSIVADQFSGLGGNDSIQGDRGNDTLEGGSGDDLILGGQGTDQIFGQAGADQLQGGTENDTINGGKGKDTLFGEEGEDFLMGDDDDDELQGGGESDNIRGNTGNDLLFGDEGNDNLLGNEDNDQLQGGRGDDTLNGGTGNDTLFGQEGNDNFVFDVSNGKDTINDFTVAEDVIIVSADFGYTHPDEIIAAINDTGTTNEGLYSELVFSQNNRIKIFHDSELTSANFVIDFPLQVTDFKSNSSGFVVQFNQPIDLEFLNLYDLSEANNQLSDLALIANQTGETVNGSVVWDEHNYTLTFLKTGGILTADTYTLTLFSREDAFIALDGELLDGNSDSNPGDNFSVQFTVADSPQRVLSLDDFSRAPGQKLDFADISLNNGAGITQVDFTLSYDSDFLGITDILVDPNLPDDWKITTKNFDNSGEAVVSLKGTTALTSSSVDLVSLKGQVNSTAVYGEASAVQLELVSLNGGTVDVIGDDAIAQIAKLGDASGNGSLSGLDASLISHLATDLSSGLTAFNLTDPLIVTDVNQDDTISALDAALVF